MKYSDYARNTTTAPTNPTGQKAREQDRFAIRAGVSHAGALPWSARASALIEALGQAV